MGRRRKLDEDGVAELKLAVERELGRRGIRFRWAWVADGRFVVLIRKGGQARSAKAGIKVAEDRIRRKFGRRKPESPAP